MGSNRRDADVDSELFRLPNGKGKMNSGHEKGKKGKAVGQSLIRLLWLTFVALFITMLLKTHLPDKMTTDDPGDI